VGREYGLVPFKKNSSPGSVLAVKGGGYDVGGLVRGWEVDLPPTEASNDHAALYTVANSDRFRFVLPAAYKFFLHCNVLLHVYIGQTYSPV